MVPQSHGSEGLEWEMMKRDVLRRGYFLSFVVFFVFSVRGVYNNVVCSTPRRVYPLFFCFLNGQYQLWYAAVWTNIEDQKVQMVHLCIWNLGNFSVRPLGNIVKYLTHTKRKSILLRSNRG